jgi:hypothetical protein
MIHEHAAQIVRGLANHKDRNRWKIWLLSGFALCLVGIAGGGILLKMRPPSASVAQDTAALLTEPEPTVTFSPLILANEPQGGWQNPDAEMMRKYLNRYLRVSKPVNARHKAGSAHQ